MKIKKAFVLAAGIGSRLKELTEKKPKCLIEVNNKPILLYQLEKLRDFGISQVCINLHHHAEQVMAYVNNQKNLGVELVYSYEEHLLDTGGALKKAAWFFDAEPFLVVNADILTGINFNSLYEAYNHTTVAVLATSNRKEESRLSLNASLELIGLQKCLEPYPQETKAYCGLALYSSEIVERAKAKKSEVFSIKDIWLQLVDQKKIIKTVAMPEECYWFDIGTKETLEAAKIYFNNKTQLL